MIIVFKEKSSVFKGQLAGSIPNKHLGLTQPLRGCPFPWLGLVCPCWGAKGDPRMDR